MRSCGHGLRCSARVRAFDIPNCEESADYKRLYLARASMNPTALGVNLSLTISALPLRIADQISKDVPDYRRNFQRNFTARSSRSVTRLSSSRLNTQFSHAR